MKRQVDYTWRVAELMAAAGMHNSTDLIPRLAERGEHTVGVAFVLLVLVDDGVEHLVRDGARELDEFVGLVGG